MVGSTVGDSDLHASLIIVDQCNGQQGAFVIDVCYKIGDGKYGAQRSVTVCEVIIHRDSYSTFCLLVKKLVVIKKSRLKMLR